MSSPTGSNEPAVPADSSAELNRSIRTKRALVGAAVPIAAILSWVLASSTHNSLWYALVAIVAVACGAFYASTGGAFGGRNRNRNR